MRTTITLRMMAPAAAALGALACAGSEPAAPPAPVQAKVARVFPKTKSLETSVLSVKLEVYNPRATPVELTEIRYRLDTHDVAGVVESTVVVGGRLDAEQVAKVDFDIDVPLPAGDGLVALVAEETSPPADLGGTVMLADGTTAGFERKTALAMPTLPRFSVHDAQAAQYQEKGIDVTFFLRLVNGNPFTQPVKGVRYTVFIGEEEVRSSEAGVGTRLTAGAAEEYEESITLEEGKYEGLARLIQAGVIDYRVSGEVRTQGLTVPFDLTGTIDLGSTE